jgi:Holliday junction resolvase-like predicted endonuclease
MISTLEELFKGRKDLFEGLYIYDKWDWGKRYPVIHLDFTEISYSNAEELKASLNKFINGVAKKEEIVLEKDAKCLLADKFAELIEQLHKATGQRVVVLIDEYDKPLIDNLTDKEVYPQVKRALHNFYQVIKASDEHVKFVLLTGVSQFSGLSIFSGLNNLNNITMDSRYGSICGYTQEELESSFKEHIEYTAKELKKSEDKLLSEIKRWYNGYSWDGKEFVYNPFSTLKFFDSKEFAGHWYETGTPTFLIKQVEKMEELSSLVKPQRVSSEVLKGADNEEMDAISLMFQTGYLTVKGKAITERGPVYTVDFPNYEVKSAFLTRLMAVSARKTQREAESIRDKIYAAMEAKDAIKLQEGLSELFAGIPYELHMSKERYYHSKFLLAMRFVGYEVEGEVHTDKGRIDVVIKDKERVVVVEIKYAKGKGTEIERKIEEAMGQIKDTKYYERYKSSDVSLLGIVFGENKEIRCRFENVSRVV